MADGQGKRWNNYKNIPKHLIRIKGETLLEHTVKLVKKYDPKSEVIITSHDPRYEIEGAVRYEPQNNILEIDRFTRELIEDNICFLYGDTYYTDTAMRRIVFEESEDLLFFGTKKSIVAIKVADSSVFRTHVDNVRSLYLKGEIEHCIGWQVYQSFMGLPFDEKKIDGNYVYLEDSTQDFNTPDDLEQ